MTVTLPLELARPRPIDLPNTAPPITSTTNKRNKSRGPSAKRKSAPKAASVVPEPSPANQGPPLYEQFGTVPTNPTYHLARVGHAIRQARNIIVISGAGVSTPAIPDFRSSRGLFKTLADDEKRKNMLEAETCGKTRAQKREAAAEAASAAASSSKSGMRSGKELFDVKCLTVCHRGASVVEAVRTTDASSAPPSVVSRSATTSPQSAQSPYTPHLAHPANAIPSLPENSRRPRPLTPVLHAKH